MRDVFIPFGVAAAYWLARAFHYRSIFGRWVFGRLRPEERDRLLPTDSGLAYEQGRRRERARAEAAEARAVRTEGEVRELEAEAERLNDYTTELDEEIRELRDQRDRAVDLLRTIDAHYSGSLDYRPTYVKLVREFVEALDHTQDLSTPDESNLTTTTSDEGGADSGEDG